MSFAEQLKKERERLGLTRAQASATLPPGPIPGTNHQPSSPLLHRSGFFCLHVWAIKGQFRPSPASRPTAAYIVGMIHNQHFFGA
jgi:hypothetical protein